jgi:hypothetical protein
MVNQCQEEYMACSKSGSLSTTKCLLSRKQRHGNKQSMNFLFLASSPSPLAVTCKMRYCDIVSLQLDVLWSTYNEMKEVGESENFKIHGCLVLQKLKWTVMNVLSDAIWTNTRGNSLKLSVLTPNFYSGITLMLYKINPKHCHYNKNKM